MTPVKVPQICCPTPIVHLLSKSIVSLKKTKERLRAPKFWQFFFIIISSSSTLFFFFLLSLKRKLTAVYITHR